MTHDDQELLTFTIYCRSCHTPADFYDDDLTVLDIEHALKELRWKKAFTTQTAPNGWTRSAWLCAECFDGDQGWVCQDPMCLSHDHNKREPS